MPVTPWPPELGKPASADGCITRLHFVINQPTDEIERRIGYSRGRLDGGWWLLLLTEPVQAGDFEFFGYSNSSGGRSGHPMGGPARQAIQDSLHQQLGGAGFLRKEKEIAAAMTISGPERIAKILPRSGEDPAIPANEAWRHYPPGSGIPQWRLVTSKRFVVAADIADGHRYCGGGAGFWLDPQAAKTMKD
jgi:hypothetical protein